MIQVGISINNVTKSIKGATVLENISLELEKGKIYGLRGKNGSGKTMLMRVICGLILPTSGTVKIDDEILGKDISFPRSIGALIESPSFIGEYSGFKNLKMIASIKNIIDDKTIKETISLVGLDPEDKKKFRKYSLGMKQRLGIACAIMEKPQIIVLDEPINALDEKGVLLVREILEKHKENSIIVVACHDREELNQLADEIFSMENGKIISHEVVSRNGGGDIDEK